MVACGRTIVTTLRNTIKTSLSLQFERMLEYLTIASYYNLIHGAGKLVSVAWKIKHQLADGTMCWDGAS